MERRKRRKEEGRNLDKQGRILVASQRRSVVETNPYPTVVVVADLFLNLYNTLFCSTKSHPSSISIYIYIPNFVCWLP